MATIYLWRSRRGTSNPLRISLHNGALLLYNYAIQRVYFRSSLLMVFISILNNLILYLAQHILKVEEEDAISFVNTVYMSQRRLRR